MIDVKISGGDVVTDSSGNPLRVQGLDALFQRAIICATVPQGSFIYDRELGAGRAADDSQRTELLLAEALVKYPGTSVRVLSVSGGSVSVQLTIGGESRTQEVIRYGDI